MNTKNAVLKSIARARAKAPTGMLASRALILGLENAVDKAVHLLSPSKRMAFKRSLAQFKLLDDTAYQMAIERRWG
jgi:hypothetical protein